MPDIIFSFVPAGFLLSLVAAGDGHLELGKGWNSMFLG